MRVDECHGRFTIRRGLLGPHVDAGMEMTPRTGSRLQAEAGEYDNGDRRRRCLL
jgi:hypothetical protein